MNDFLVERNRAPSPAPTRSVEHRGRQAPASRVTMCARVAGRPELGGPLASKRRRLPAIRYAALLLAMPALVVGGCGGETKTSTSAHAATTRPSKSPAWQPGTVAPKVTPALIAKAGHRLNVSNTNLGTADEEIGAMVSDVHVNPSAKTLDDRYARVGRCMGEYMKIHDLGHELAVLIAYTQGKDRKAQAVVEKASTVCAGKAVIPDAAFKQSLKANP